MALSVEKECKYCGQIFETTNFRKLYCSSTCKTYASHQRTGKLNKSQEALMESQRDCEAHLDLTELGKGELIKLLADHLKGLVAIGGEWSLTSADWLKYDIHPYEDDEIGLERVVMTPNKNFIYRSYCKELVYRVKSKYSGAAIFTTAGKLLKRPKPLALTGGRQHNHVIRTSVLRYVVFNTLLSLSHVLNKSEIDHKLF